MTVGSASGPVTGPIGLLTVHDRIRAIQHRIGVSSASAPPAAAVTAPAPDASFADVLQRASVSSSTAKAGPHGAGCNCDATAAARAAGLANGAAGGVVHTHKPAELPPVPITDAMRAAGNGRLPDELLVTIAPGGQRLARPAANAFLAMVEAARRDGVTFGITDSYRSYPDQVAVANRVGIYGQGGWAAVPGTSNHGWGMSLDLDLDTRGQAWMREHGWRYGFFEDVPGEPWHWTYRSA